VTEIENSNSEWLAQSNVPKLFVSAEPGGMTGSLLEFVRTCKEQREVTVCGLHFMQEESPTRSAAPSPIGWRHSPDPATRRASEDKAHRPQTEDGMGASGNNSMIRVAASSGRLACCPLITLCVELGTIGSCWCATPHPVVSSSYFLIDQSYPNNPMSES
jgi:hypothetical protein